ncbi:MAG TPA: hypothetical protein EYG92_10125 [Lutibacter sp.]|nr:hypothetical protein [Lutibacter sp.]
MHKVTSILIAFITLYTVNAQKNYSENWDDLYSYNNIVDFIQNETKIISLTDNALFIYDKLTEESEKFSSINGLSGETTSSFYYHENSKKIIIGYENGLLEIIDENNTIIVKSDIINFDILGSKSINDITAFGSTLYLSLPFGIVTFDLEINDFKDTFFIGDASSEVFVNEIEIFNNNIYAVTESGIYTAAVDEPFLVDSNNWERISSTPFSNITIFNNQPFVTTNRNIYQIENNNQLTLINTQQKEIFDLTTTEDYLCITTNSKISIFDRNLSLYNSVTSIEGSIYPFKAQTAQTFNNSLYIGSNSYGILKSDFSTINTFLEIHPEGPISNKVFSISVLNNNLWIVYGGFDRSISPVGRKKGVNHFNGEEWITIPYHQGAIQALDLSHVTIDPFHENRVYISSMHGEVGIVIIEDDVVTAHWTHTNSPLETLVLSSDPDYISVRIGDTAFDKEGNLWITNVSVDNGLKKYSASGEWSSYDTSSLIGYQSLNPITIDNNDNIWIGSLKGAWVINKGVTKMKMIDGGATTGNLPHIAVNALAVDNNNTMWIGTREGLTTFNASSSFFEQATYQTKPIVIESGEDDGFGIALLGTQKINTICVDGANNKWFGTDNGGVLYTSSSGRETFLHFDKTNSPLPSNRILDIKFDETTGKVYFATDKGLVSFDSKIVPYAAHLVDAYAYPNPVRKQHDFVTIDGRKGNHLPNGTNVKILDAAGRLVYETNVVAGQEQFGGKVTWNKTNLAGRKVASGIYVVLLTIPDATETAMTKIAIIN